MRKLIRDRVPAIMAVNNQPCRYHVADPSEHRDRLIDKLSEEAAELRAAHTSAAVTGELADLLEVVYALADHAELDRAALERARAAKHAERGGFTRRLVWHGPESNLTRGRTDPDSYPERHQEGIDR